MCSVLFFAFFTEFPRFLFKHLFCVSLFSSFSLPFSSCFSLLVCVFLLDFSLFVFFIFFFSPFFPLFFLFCFSLFMVFGAFLSKKTFALKSLLFFCPFILKMVFENVLKFDLCHTSPFVFNSCVTYFSFLPRLRNISSLFLNFVSGELPYFLCFFLFSFLLLCIHDFLFLYLVSFNWISCNRAHADEHLRYLIRWIVWTSHESKPWLPPGIEPGTCWSAVSCSNHWAMHPWDLCPDQQPENCTVVNQQPNNHVQAYIVHVKRNRSEFTRPQDTWHNGACWHANDAGDSFPWAINHGRSPDCAVTYTTWVTQRRDSTTSPLSSRATQTSVTFAHDSGCAKENVTRLNRHSVSQQQLSELTQSTNAKCVKNDEFLWRWIFHFVHFVIQKKNLLVFFTLFLFCHLFSVILFFHHFFAFILSTLLSARFFHGLPFLVRLKKLSPLIYYLLFLSFSLSPCSPIACFSYLLFTLISFSFLSVFFFSFFLHFSFLSWDPLSQVTVKHVHRHSSNRMLM